MKQLSIEKRECQAEKFKRSEFIVQEILDSKEVVQNIFLPKYLLLYEKIRWRKVILQADSTVFTESTIKTEQYIKIMEIKNEYCSLICLDIYYLNDGQPIGDLMREISHFNISLLRENETEIPP